MTTMTTTTAMGWRELIKTRSTKNNTPKTHIHKTFYFTLLFSSLQLQAEYTSIHGNSSAQKQKKKKMKKRKKRQERADTERLWAVRGDDGRTKGNDTAC